MAEQMHLSDWLWFGLALSGWWSAVHFRDRAFTAEATNAKHDSATKNEAARDERIWQNVMSTVEIANRTREWRQRRALQSRDHLVKHSVEAWSDSDAAREILIFCAGQSECGE